MNGDGATSVVARSLDDVDRELAWRSGRLELAGETLAYAVEQFNRHSKVTIRVADGRLNGQKLYGAFRLDDPAGFARTAATAMDATVERRDGAIILDR